MKKEILELSQAMKNHSIDAYIVTSSDSHASEYVHPHFRYRAYASGFTGSAGTLLVMRDADMTEAFLWTDSRYFLQAESELSNSEITLMKIGEPGVPSLEDFLSETLKNGAVCGADADTVSCGEGKGLIAAITRAGASFKNIDLADEIWKDRPPLSSSDNIFILDERVTGESATDKLTRVRAFIQNISADIHVISGLDDIAWLLNLRGNDVKDSPVFYSRLVISKDECRLYAFKEAFDENVKNYVSELGVRLLPYNDFYDDFEKLFSGKTVLFDPGKSTYAVYDRLKKISRILTGENPSDRMKAIKNETEIAALKNANILDGVAMVRFIFRVKKAARESEAMSELGAAELLWKKRREAGAFSESFETIAGYKEHGAIVHYSADKTSDKQLENEGFLLVDSGGHYNLPGGNGLISAPAAGTTDITRTIALGPISDEMRDNYSRVLMGAIDLASAVFPENATGAQLDTLAHKYLWEKGLDFKHGTGHGIGFILNVHEGPQSISYRGMVPFCEGMVTSDEPGVYLDGEYGIRIENDILCKKAERDGMLCFETLTLCPFEKDAIKKELLNKKQLGFINDYHKKVFSLISPYLSDEENAWLKSVTSPI